MKNRQPLGSRIMGFLLRMGAPFGPMALLTVKGRKSGQPRSAPVAVVPHGGGWRLLSVYGTSEWVRNLRAAGKARLTVRGTPIMVSATELDPIAAAPFVRASLASAGSLTRRMIGPHFAADAHDPIEVWQNEAVHHPLFQLTPLQVPRQRGTTILKVLTGLLIIGIAVQVALAGIGTFGQADAFEWHRVIGIVTEAVALITAIVAIVLRRAGVRWLTTGIFILIAFQHGTAAIGGAAGGLHALNALLMLVMASVARRRLYAGIPIPAAPHVTRAGDGPATAVAAEA